MTMVAANQAIYVPGTHDMKLMKALKGRNVQLTHGLAEFMEQLAREPEEFREQVAKFLDGLVRACFKNRFGLKSLTCAWCR